MLQKFDVFLRFASSDDKVQHCSLCKDTRLDLNIKSKDPAETTHIRLILPWNNQLSNGSNFRINKVDSPRVVKVGCGTHDEIKIMLFHTGKLLNCYFIFRNI
jgi:hypothetical protein